MDKATLLITILLSLACGVVANLSTPLVKSLFWKGIFGSRQARIKSLREKLELGEYYLNNRNALNLYQFKELFRIMFWFLLGVLLLLLGDLNNKGWYFRLAMMPIAFALGRASGNVSFARWLRDFEEHKKKIREEIERLESKLPLSTGQKFNNLSKGNLMSRPQQVA